MRLSRYMPQRAPAPRRATEKMRIVVAAVGRHSAEPGGRRRHTGRPVVSSRIGWAASCATNQEAQFSLVQFSPKRARTSSQHRDGRAHSQGGRRCGRSSLRHETDPGPGTHTHRSGRQGQCSCAVNNGFPYFPSHWAAPSAKPSGYAQEPGRFLVRVVAAVRAFVWLGFQSTAKSPQPAVRPVGRPVGYPEKPPSHHVAPGLVGVSRHIHHHHKLYQSSAYGLET